MPYGEDGARHGSHGKRRESRGSKACGKSGILHANFDGERLRLRRRELEQFAEPETAAVTEQVMENYHGENDRTGGKNFCRVMRNDCCHNHRNRNHGNEWQDFNCPRRKLAEKLVDDESECNRHNHDFHDGKEHRHHIHVHGRAQKQIRNRRRQNRSKQRVHARHAHRECDIAFRKVRDDVTRSAARASAHEDHARHQCGIEPENFGEQECERGHHNKLRRATDGDFFGARKHERKIAELERKPHTEHHDHQEVIYPRKFNPES